MSKTALIVIAVAAICVAAGITAFFVLQDKSYDIEYDLNGGDFVSDYPQTYKSGKTLEIPTPMKDGYISAGFYTDPELTHYFNGDTKGMEDVLKLYARWIESPIGYSMTFSEEGECDRGFSSYILTGERVKLFYLYSTRSDTLYAASFGTDNYEYTDTHESYSKMIVDVIQSPGYINYVYRGTETLDTIDGMQVCDRYTTTYENGATGTMWIKGKLIYKECYDFIGTEDSDIKSEHITNTLQSAYSFPVPEEGTLTMYCGEGISVPDYERWCKVGDYVTLTAEMEKGKSFGGWYDTYFNLVSTDKTYSFEYFAATTFYAMGSMDDRCKFDKNKKIDFDEIFGLRDATYSIYSLDTGASISSGSAFTFTQNGMYRISAKTDSGNYAYWAEVVGSDIREYTWKWDGDTYTVSMDIDYEDYLYAKNYYSINERHQERPDHVRDKTFVELSYKDDRMSRYTEKIADLLIDAYKENNSKVTLKDYLNYLLAFTQYIPYQTDEEYLGYNEYWKFPLETLFDNGGDCEDTTILFVSIAHESMEKLGFDYDLALQILPGHMCVAVKNTDISARENPYGYIYGETTAKNYKIGDIPDKMKDSFLDESYYPNRSFTVEIE